MKCDNKTGNRLEFVRTAVVTCANSTIEEVHISAYDYAFIKHFVV